MVEIYLIIAIIVTIFFLVILRFDKSFDKYVHDKTNGQMEFTSWDKIMVPLFVGITWPWGVFVIIRKIVHG